MGRIRPAWYYQRQATEAQQRATFLQNRTAPAAGTTIAQRGASTELFYRSLIQREGTDALIYKVPVLNSTLALITAAQAGLRTTLAAGEIALRTRGSGVKPTRIHWYKGDATPTRQRSAWGTSWARYYDTAGARSHYSMPFSKATGIFDGGDLQESFEGLFGSSGTERALLGTSNGRAYITFEEVSLSYSS